MTIFLSKSFRGYYVYVISIYCSYSMKNENILDRSIDCTGDHHTNYFVLMCKVNNIKVSICI